MVLYVIVLYIRPILVVEVAENTGKDCRYSARLRVPPAYERSASDRPVERHHSSRPLGGFIRQRGLAVMSVFGNIVVSLSWFGVNMLGLGLNS
jgi:hypothetical protein